MALPSVQDIFGFQHHCARQWMAARQGKLCLACILTAERVWQPSRQHSHTDCILSSFRSVMVLRQQWGPTVSSTQLGWTICTVSHQLACNKACSSRYNTCVTKRPLPALVSCKASQECLSVSIGQLCFEHAKFTQLVIQARPMPDGLTALDRTSCVNKARTCCPSLIWKPVI